MLSLEVEKKLFIGKSPEEELCKTEIRKCLNQRDQLISQFYMQLQK